MESIRMGSRHFEVFFRQKLKKVARVFIIGSQLLSYSVIFSHLVFIPYAHAGPIGGQVVGGDGSISQSGLITNIDQNTASLAIDWASYNINSNEIVNYLQPNSSAIALNRILGTNASQIHGQINANGQIILVNPNGIFFGPTASINVGSLIASGLDMNPSDFMNGQYIFNEKLGADGTVINSGTINASLGGSVTLLGKRTENDGLISAKLGAVNLAAGKEAVITFDSNGLIGVKVTKAVLQDELGIDPAVLNTGKIDVEGGRVLMTGSVSSDIFSQAVNTGDMEQASSVVANGDGTFSLGAGADVVNAGNIDVSTKDGNAGQVVILGENVTSSGVIRADAEQGAGGEIELHANNVAELTDSSLTSARAETSGQGGVIRMLGDKVGLRDQSTVDVSGANGGGMALIGGDRQGKNEFVKNASFVFLGKDARVFADALDKGDGGKLITFANDTARIYGGLYARGGINGGNGGLIETSGKWGFDINTVPDVSASLGQSGLWLIDPFNISILDSGDAASYGTGGTPPDTVYTSSQDSAFIDVATIEAALENGNVEIVTGDPVSPATTLETGNITFFTSLDYDSAGDNTSNTLTLNAAGNIEFLGGSTISDSNNTGDSLNVNLFANGDVVLNATVDIDTQGGNFTVGDTTNTIIPTSFTNNGTVDTTGAFDTDGGDITITTSGAVVSTGLSAAGGNTGTSSNSATNRSGRNGGSVNIDAASVVVSGAIDTSGSNGTFDTNQSGNNGQNGGNAGQVSITASTGNISVSTIDAGGGAAAGDFSGDTDTGNGGSAGSITLDAGSGLVNLSGDLLANGGTGEGGGTDGNGAAISITGQTVLVNSVTLNADGNTRGTVSFSDTVTGTTDRTEGLTVTGNNINFGGMVGSSVRLGGISLDATGSIDATAQNIFSGSFSVTQSSGFVSANINTQGTSNGDVGIASSGAINTGDILTTGGATGNGGDIDLAGTDIAVGTINTAGGSTSGNAGQVTIAAADAGANTPSITLNGDIITNVTAGTATSSDLSLNGGVGATGTLTVNYASNFTSSFNVTGSSGTDTIIAANRVNSWLISNGDTGTLNSSLAFDAFENLTGNASTDNFTLSTTSGSISGTIDGGAGENTLTGRNSSTSWTISAANAGSSDDVNAFSNIANLVGGTNTDDFTLSGTGSLTGTINGGTGSSNSLTNRNTANTWSITAANSGTVTNVGGFSNIQDMTGGTSTDDFVLTGTGSVSGTLDGGTGVNSLTARDVVNNWSITDSNTGSVDNVAGFINIESLTGGTAADNFTLTSSSSAITGSIDGGLGANTLTGRDTATTWTVSSANAGSSDDVASFSNIASLVGGSNNDDFILSGTGSLSGTINGGGGSNSLTARDVVNTWTITAANAGTVTNTGGFSNIRSLIGGANTDTFTLSGTGSLGGSINGGGGTNTLTARDVANTWDISSADGGDVTNVSNGFSNIQNLVGGTSSDNFTLSGTGSLTGTLDGGAGNNSLTARDVANSWIISGANSGSVTNTGGFFNIGTLTGGSNTDVFVLSGTGTLSGAIDGGGGGGINSLTARDTDNTWIISGADSGTLTNINGFQRIHNITGGAGVDTISYSTTSSNIQGLIDGGAGIDSLNISILNSSDVTVNLGNGSSSGPNPIVVNVDNVEDITANVSRDNQIVGDNIQNSWTIDEANGGRVAPTIGATAESTVAFHNFSEIVGGSNDDTFAVISSGSASSIDGGDQVLADTVDYSGQLTPVVVDLGSGGLSNFITGLEGVIGNGTDSTIIGDDTVNVWGITNGNTGTIGSLTFIDFTHIQGNDNTDTLNITLTGTEVGGITFDGGLNNDTVNLDGGNAGYAGVYTPDALVGHDQLAYTNAGNTYTVNYQNTESIQDNLIANSLTVNGTALDDSISLGTDDTPTFRVNINPLVNFENKQTLIVNGLAGTDVVDTLGTFDLGSGNLHLIAETINNTANALITANAFILDGVSSAGAGNRLLTNVTDLGLTGVSGAVRISEQDQINISQLDTTGPFDLSADQTISSAGLNTSADLTLASSNGDILLDNAANTLGGSLALTAANGTVNVRNNTTTSINTISAQDLTINSTGAISQTGGITVSGATGLSSSADITLTGANNFNTLGVTSANNVSINDTNALEITGINASGAVAVNSSGLALGSISAASASLDAGSGAITDTNGNASNIAAGQIQLRASSGIGSGNALETQTANLDVINSTSGNVEITNNGQVTLTNLVNNGDITFRNDQTVTIDNVDAGYTVGRFEIDVASGSIYGVPRAPADYLVVPDITADSAFITVPDEFGTYDRPIVMLINSDLFLEANVSSPHYLGDGPDSIINNSVITASVVDAIGSASQQRLIEVESIEDIDPAIFTAVRNYNYDDISIRMPRDQLYEDELDRLGQ